jgi:hypothetical protein
MPFFGGGPLTRKDRKFWAQARTLDALCDRTVLWLQGHLASQPGYYGRVDVDEDKAPGLTRALVACNQAGFLTCDSQAGFVGDGYGGWRWSQMASVAGFAAEPLYRRLAGALASRGFKTHASPCSRRRPTGVVVTTTDGRPYTTFGGASASDIEFNYSGCHRQAIAEVRASLQVTIYDLKPGRNTLWRVLERAAKQAAR